MAGSGVNAGNALLLAKTEVQALHLTGKATKSGAMNYRKSGVNMASVLPSDEYEITYSNELKIKAVIEAVQAKNINY